MSANGANNGSTFPHSTISIVHTSLNSLMISHTFLTLLVPLFISLFYFSTPQIRLRPLFILNVVAILLAFVVGIMTDAFTIHNILSPIKPWPALFNVLLSSIGMWQSIFVDLILLVRLISVYPPWQIGTIHFSLLITIPVLLKLTRVINLIAFTKTFIDIATHPSSPGAMLSPFSSMPYLKVDWSAQMVDNTYASLAFLWKLRDSGRKRISSQTISYTVTMAQRIRTLSHIALENFLVPTIFSFAQFIYLYHKHSNPFILSQLIMVNTMLSTFGVTFATVWAGSVCRQEVASSISRTRSVAIAITHYSETLRDDVK